MKIISSVLAGEFGNEIFREKMGDTSRGRESYIPAPPVHEVDMAIYHQSCKNYIKY